LISYGLLSGKCRHCRTPISPRYPLVELIVGLLTLALFYKSGISIRFLAELYLVLALVAATFIDLDVMIIPDAITLPGMAVGVLAAALAPDPGLIGPWLGGMVMSWGVESFRFLSVIGSVLGLALGWGLIWSIIMGYSLLTGKEGMGGGDLTLLAMIGAFLGWRSIFLTIFFGSIFALAVYFVLAARAKVFDAKAMLPFGPFLSLAALVYLFFGERIIDWYLG
jgi:leader peptidase (prepilin peptidase)/N-methyltransferase